MRGRPARSTLHRGAERRGRARQPATPSRRPRHDTTTAEARGGRRSRSPSEIAAGTRPEDIAVLYRVNAQAAALEAALDDAGVSYQLRGATRFFDLPEVKQAIMMLQGALDRRPRTSRCSRR